MDRWCVISYCTPHYYWFSIPDKLIKSTTAFKLPHTHCLVPSRGSWERNCSFKARFCFQMLEMLDDFDAVVYVDSDAVFHKYPKLFDDYLENNICFAAHKKRWELLSGTLFIRKCHLSKMIMEDWLHETEKNPDKWDQKTLQPIFEKYQELEGEKYIANLPVEYCKIFDAPDMECDPVIEHFQASRKMKREVNET